MVNFAGHVYSNLDYNDGRIKLCITSFMWFWQAYLAYGVPRSDLKLFSLMQKVGHVFTLFLVIACIKA